MHQASSACYDYFKWGDYLTGNGTDHAEGGWMDRDYYAIALACSMGILNEVPQAYCAQWGAPQAIHQRYADLVSVYGAGGAPGLAIVQNMQHRDTEVLMLYPIDLVAADERFGSWMTQYGYANYVTQAKLLERGEVRDGAIEMAGRRFTTLAALYEPFPSQQLLDMAEALAAQGGRVVWSGPPPWLDASGANVRVRWAGLFGVEPEGLTEAAYDGLRAPGRRVTFEGALAGVPAQTILTDLLVDRVYPMTPKEGVETVARMNAHTAGTVRRTEAGGTLAYLGFRPRDDQSESLGYEVRTWFEVLNALGAYPGTGAFAQNDNPDYLSRTTEYLVCRFPNGAVAVAPHFHDVEEGWPGGFARNREEDEAYMAAHPLRPNELHLEGFQAAGHTISYNGTGALAFQLDASGRLAAFAGNPGQSITVDGAAYDLADAGIGHLAFAPAPPERQKEGGARMLMLAHGLGFVRLPAPDLHPGARVVAQGPAPGSAGEAVSCSLDQGVLTVEITPQSRGRWLYVLDGQ